MAPSIARLFDSEVRVWRPLEGQDRLGTVRRSYDVIATYGAAVNRSVAPEANLGPGFAPTGRLRMYLLPTANVQERDVIEVISGPDAGRRWEVDMPPVRPRAHHTQLDLIAWQGDLEAAS